MTRPAALGWRRSSIIGWVRRTNRRVGKGGARSLTKAKTLVRRAHTFDGIGRVGTAHERPRLLKHRACAFAHPTIPSLLAGALAGASRMSAMPCAGTSG